MANEYLKRTPTSTGNRKKWTWCGWVRINDNTPTDGWAWLYNTSVNGGIMINFDAPTYTSQFQFYDNAGTQIFFSEDSFRDPSSWYHIIVVWDSTNTTETERFRFYVNGKRLQKHPTISTTYPSLNVDSSWNNTIVHSMGRWENGASRYIKSQYSDQFFIDGQALTPEVFGFYKDGNGYISAGSTQATDFRNGQWVPRTPREIKNLINDNGGFGVNGFYLPMNDSSNFGADFHCDPNSIIKLKGEGLAQPRNGAPGITTNAYVDNLRSDPYAANLVLAVPGITDGQGSGYGDYSADIKGSGSNKTVTANGNAGVAVTASYYGSALSFDGTGDYFSMPDNDDFNFAAGDFTVEAWIKGATGGTKTGSVVFNQSINSATSNSAFYFGAGTDGTSLYLSTSGNSWTDNITSSVEVDNDCWNHLVWQRRGTYLELYTNGVCVGIKTNFSGTVYNSTRDVQIGVQDTAGNSDFEGYIQDLRVYKGVAKYKGGFDVPKPYTPVGIGTWRAVPDICQNNFATLNGVVNSLNGSNESFSNGNLTVSNTEFYESTIGITTGKWYWEYYEDSYSDYGTYNVTGLVGSATTFADRGQVPNIPHGGTIWYAPGRSSGAIVVRGTTYNSYDLINMTHPTETLPLTSAGNVYAIALDLDSAQGIGSTGGVYFYINGVGIDQNPQPLPDIYQGISTTGNVVAPGVYASGTQTINFGQNPTFSGNTTAGTFTDSNGKGLFKYQPPTGFLALCEDNLPTPAIKDPGEHFKTVLYSGSSSERSITGLGFKPDLVWIKDRDRGTSTYYHALYDSIRGSNRLSSNLTSAEADDSLNGLKSFDDDGFSIGVRDQINGSSNFVAWCWKAGGPAVLNTKGSITSQVSANQTAGFSIVSYAGDNTNANKTVGHGLNKIPKFIIVKTRSEASRHWLIWHDSFDDYDDAMLFTTGTPAGSRFGPGAPTSDVFGVYGGQGNRGTETFIAYCWTEIEGFSKFGSYTGNGSSDGPFVYCGFKPAWVMIKCATATSNAWVIYDNARGSSNVNYLKLGANGSWVENYGAELGNSTTQGVDFLSNGFKIRITGSNHNNNEKSYIFAAFAESPFQTANAK